MCIKMCFKKNRIYSKREYLLLSRSDQSELINSRTRARPCTPPAHAHTRTHMCVSHLVCVRTRMRTNARTFTHLHTLAHAYIPLHTHTNTHTNTHTHTQSGEVGIPE